MISRELLSEVLGLDEKFINDDIKHDGDYLTWSFEGEDTRPKVNVYKLQHLMKEWALKNGYYLLSGIYTYNGFSDGTYSCFINQNFSSVDDGEFISRGESSLHEYHGFFQETDVVTKACLWVQKNKDKR